MADSLNIGGGKWHKLVKADGWFTGKVIDAEEREHTYEGKTVLSKAGNIRREWVLTFEVPESDEYPDGAVKISFLEGGKKAIATAVKDAGGKTLDVGGTLAVKVTEDAVQGKKGAEYTAKWKLPTKSLSVTATAAEDDDPFAETAAPAASDAPF